MHVPGFVKTGYYYYMNFTQHWSHCLENDFTHAPKAVEQQSWDTNTDALVHWDLLRLETLWEESGNLSVLS